MKKGMFLSLVIAFNTVFGQQVIDVDHGPEILPNQAFYNVSGLAVNPTRYIKVTSGSPYFSDTWMKGTVYITDSTGAENVRVRLDLLEGSLLYMNEKNEEMLSVTPVRQVTMTDTTTGKKYTFVPAYGITNNPGKSWYQVLAGKQFTLLKEISKKITESKSYGSSITEQDIRTFETYYIRFNNTITKVKKFTDITGLAGNKADQLQKYIDKNSLSIKKEADIIALVDYYQSLD